MIVYGHRGARGESPENTIASCQHAAQRGVRHIEIDLRLSKDDQLVVLHDNRLKRTAGESGKVGEYTARELAKMDARASGTPWPNRKKTGIPTWSALSAAVPEIHSWQLELKPGSRRYNKRLVDVVHEQLSGGHKGCIVTSSDPGLIAELKQRLPKLDTGFVSGMPDPRDILRMCDCTYLIARWDTLDNPSLILSVRRKNIHISAWTVNDASVIRELHKRKVDSVISDYPSMALPLVAELQR